MENEWTINVQWMEKQWRKDGECQAKGDEKKDGGEQTDTSSQEWRIVDCYSMSYKARNREELKCNRQIQWSIVFGPSSIVLYG